MNIRILIAVVLFVCATSSTAVAQSGRLVNLRATRVPNAPFTSSDGEWEWTATPHAAMRSGTGVRVTWSLDVAMTGVGVDSAIVLMDESRGITEITSDVSRPGARSLQVVAEAPWRCRIDDQRRTFIVLAMQAEGVTHHLSVDNECVLGDMLPWIDGPVAYEFYDLPESDAVEELVTGIREHATSITDLDEVLRVFYSLLQERSARYRSDPRPQADEPIGYAAYALNPDETLRFGGDCEDWSILIAAVLTRLGFDSAPIVSDLHVTVRVTGEADRIVDWAPFDGTELSGDTPLTLF